MFGKQSVDNLSVEELEKMLLVKRRQSRMERFQRFTDEGRSQKEALLARSTTSATPFPKKVQKSQKENKAPKTRARKIMDVSLLGLEVVALLGLVGVLVASYVNLRELNDEVSLAQQSVVEQQIAAIDDPDPAPAISVARLPGGHTPPTAPGGAIPDVPPHLQQWVQSNDSSMVSGAIEISPHEAVQATRIVIPKIDVNAPIISGVSWADLKKGVGHLPGSANPGERGNMYLAAHNDIYGEIFRYLEDLEVGDEYFIYAGEAVFRYVVTEKRIIDPTEVDVMLATTEPVATLQTCYPYLVDSHRLVVISELAE